MTKIVTKISTKKHAYLVTNWQIWVHVAHLMGKKSTHAHAQVWTGFFFVILFLHDATKIQNKIDMKNLVFIFFVLLLLGITASGCRTTREVHHYDTLTVERAVERVVTVHDTVTQYVEKVKVVEVRDTSSETEDVVEVTTREEYDTAGRLRAATTTLKQKNKKSQKGTTAQSANTEKELKTQGTTIDSTATDSTSIKQGSKTDVKETKPHVWGNFVLWSVLGTIIVGIIAFVIYRIK